MRLEPNISVREVKNQESGIRNQELPPYKVEVKNINSFRFLERAIEYEIKRQKEILEKGEIPVQETRGFDEVKMRTLPQREKEEAHDYRYFPEPDLPPLRWEAKKVEEIRAEIPELPDAKIARFMGDYGLSAYDAIILTTTLSVASYFEEAVRAGQKHNLTPKQLANVIINKKVDTEKILPAELVQMLLKKSQAPTLSDRKLEKIVKQVLLDNKQAVSDYKGGKEEALMFLVGQVMKAAKGQAKAEDVKKLLKEKL